MNFSYAIDDSDFVKQARALPDKLERKVYRQAANRAATPALKEARRLTHSSTVRKALTKKAQSNAAKGYFGQLITIKQGVFRSTRTAKRRGVGNVYYPDEAARFGIFIEIGTKYNPSRPFLRPAIESTKGQYRQIMQDEIFKGIEKVTRR